MRAVFGLGRLGMCNHENDETHERLNTLRESAISLPPIID